MARTDYEVLVELCRFIVSEEVGYKYAKADSLVRHKMLLQHVIKLHNLPIKVRSHSEHLYILNTNLLEKEILGNIHST